MTPSGATSGAAAGRARMVREHLAARGIADPRVLDAMGRVARERFVPSPLKERAYDDRALPIDAGQTISQPYMVARTLELARIGPGAHVLDVGTGSGYQAAVLAELARSVVSIERIEALALAARRALAPWPHVEVVLGDGSLGWPARAPYDAIVAAAAAPALPPAWLTQLRPGGRVVVPLGPRDQQRLTVIEADGSREVHDACVYVPLIGAEGFAG